MSPAPRILAFAGSTRSESFNKKLIRIAADGARAAGAEVTLLDLRDFSMPLFDQDAEASGGMPDAARRFKEQMLAHQGLLISSPEYNSSISGVLKNAMDWASRAAPGEAPLAAYSGKAAGLLSASPGGLGGLRGLVHLRAILGNINVLVIPEQFSLVKAHEAFTPEGALKDGKAKSAAENIGAKLAALLQQLLGK